LDRALHYLLQTPNWGQPLQLAIRRGMPHPYSSHPRLDLFLGSLSPHPTGKFGCTICHQGQGSATSFAWASHTPSSPEQASQWAHQYGWFYNHNWIFPMYPRQFEESGCLKCHHEVVDLEPSPKFPDPPAPTLVKGYELIRNYGCFGCHDINGFNGPQKRVGPDLRAEPPFYAAAQQLQSDAAMSKLPDDIKSEVNNWVETVVHHPENDEARHRLQEFITAQAQSKTSILSPRSLVMDALLKDVETPGTFRKVGPSLRYVASKDSYDFLFSWIRNPRDFRPTTKMPRFFGLWDHLVPEQKLDANGRPEVDAEGRPVVAPSKGLHDSQQFEPIEVRSIVHYLLTESQPFEYLKGESGITAEPSVERGKKAFEMRCIACHQHADFPQATATQGPNLSRMGAKLSLKPYGIQWLYSWIKNPSHYHVRTVMPNTLLTPVKESDGTQSDPIADITAFLMKSTQDWKPADVPSAQELTPAESEALSNLALQYVREKFPAEKAKQYVEEGIPLSRSSGVKGDELFLLRDDKVEQTPAQQATRLLKYVGRRSISKYGCSACHDIPGFEDAKPIGTSLADWGRKDPARLAFEQIGEYITQHSWPKAEAAEPAGTAHAMHSPTTGPGNAAPEDLDYAIKELGPTQGWLMEKLLGHEREGFLWQKLRAPRSYDFKKTENKGYNERLRMPQFSLNEDEIEAVMTFVLGLVAEPPAPQYIANYSNNPRERAIIAGTKQVEQFNCTGCHQLDFERWDVAFKSGELGAAVETKDYPFELPHFTTAQIDASQQEDRRGRFHAQLYGRPLVTATGELATTDESESGDPFEGGGLGVRFALWRDVLLEGKPWLVGAKNPLVPQNRLEAKYAGRGGDLGRWIYPVVVADELKVNSNAKAEEGWGWLPPPLVGEGKKVQTKWLHDFLLDPMAIRPAVVLRMPKFNMSSDESSKLVDFFAARDDAPTPYEFDPRTSSDYLQTASLEHPKRLDDALRIITDNDYCVKCHLVGDYLPPGSVRSMGPQLDRVNERLRPDYVHRWVGDPKRILSYTGMPVNIPYDKPVKQSLFPGTSDQQLEGVVDLLMNWDRFTKERFTLKPWIKPAPAAATPPAAGAE
jgi:mono/diheme cytochrome c family protein